MAAQSKLDKSNRHINYTCTSCGKETNKEKLTAKRVEFSTYGKGSKRLRTRTVARLCLTCRDKDPAWNQERYLAAPGFDDLKDKHRG